MARLNDRVTKLENRGQPQLAIVMIADDENEEEAAQKWLIENNQTSLPKSIILMQDDFPGCD